MSARRWRGTKLGGRGKTGERGCDVRPFSHVRRANETQLNGLIAAQSKKATRKEKRQADEFVAAVLKAATRGPKRARIGFRRGRSRDSRAAARAFSRSFPAIRGEANQMRNGFATKEKEGDPYTSAHMHTRFEEKAHRARHCTAARKEISEAFPAL